ncbi:MAG TPA: secondary thiamine-phosphate synthase enzyme YjbQ [Exilispira sp.]|nr:secondary thiamine-phosphate synthase enzyme YjbQ [Exilispira sp.]
MVDNLMKNISETSKRNERTLITTITKKSAEQLAEYLASNGIKVSYLHSEGNSDAHIKSSIIGSSVSIIVENGRIQLGRWQGIFFAEFDGPRTREVWCKFIPSI